jgi:hypothetical protein
VERAIGRGEIPSSSDAELILDMLYGPLYHRYLHGHLPLTDRFAIAVADMTAAAAVAGAAVPQASRSSSVAQVGQKVLGTRNHLGGRVLRSAWQPEGQ